MPLSQKNTFALIAGEVLRLKQLKAAETRAAATRQITRLIKNFGPLLITEITSGRWAEYILREQARRRRTFYDDRKYMRMILIHALNEGLLTKRIPLPIPDIPSAAGREITSAELKRLEAAASPELRFQIRVGWKMGLRLREMLRLRWDQFCWESSTIAFSPAQTKTRRGRVVPIPPDLLAIFSARRALSGAQYVFPSRSPTAPVNSNRKAWGGCKKAAQISARWHDLRHTCATLMLRRGVKPHVVCRYLGMSEEVLRRIYSHLSLDDLREAARAMSTRRRKAA